MVALGSSPFTASGLPGQGLTKVLATEYRQDETPNADNETLVVEELDEITPLEMQGNGSSSLKTGDVVLQIEDEWANEGPELEHGQTPDTESTSCSRRSTARSGKNWLLLFISFLASYSMFTYAGIPDEEMCSIDWFLKWAMGKFWNPSTRIFVIVVVIYISSISAVIYRQGYSWTLSMGISLGFGHSVVNIWRGDWEEMLLRDLPMTFVLVTTMQQILLAIEARTGWVFILERRMRQEREVEARKMEDSEAQVTDESRIDKLGRPKEDRRHGGYGTC
ncbi:hypothetical protein EsH8_II_001461 [Colletotrichum jinshuiense]